MTQFCLMDPTWILLSRQRFLVDMVMWVFFFFLSAMIVIVIGFLLLLKLLSVDILIWVLVVAGWCSCWWCLCYVFVWDLVNAGLLAWNLLGCLLLLLVLSECLLVMIVVFIVSASPKSVSMEKEIGIFFIVKCRWLWYIGFNASAQIFALSAWLNG